VLCLGCGLQLREYLQGNAYTLAPAYDNEGKDWKGRVNDGDERSRSKDGDGVPGGVGGERRRAPRNAGLVRAHWTGPTPSPTGHDV